MGKTPEYTKRAIERYTEKKDRLTLLLEKGTKERFKAKYPNKSISRHIQELLDADLKEQPTRSENVSPDQDLEIPTLKKVDTSKMSSLEELQKMIDRNKEREAEEKREKEEKENQEEAERNEVLAWFKEQIESLTPEQKEKAIEQLKETGVL